MCSSARISGANSRAAVRIQPISVTTATRPKSAQWLRPKPASSHAASGEYEMKSVVDHDEELEPFVHLELGLDQRHEHGRDSPAR